MILGGQPHVEQAPGEEERQFWDRALGRYGAGGPIEGASPAGVALLAPEDDSVVVHRGDVAQSAEAGRLKRLQ